MLRGSCAWHLRRPRRCRIRGTPCRWSARDGRGSRGRPHRNNRFRKTACRLLVALCRGADASGYVASVPRMGHVRPRDAGRVPQTARHKQGRRMWISIRRPCERSLFCYERCGHVAAEPALCRFLVNCGRSCVAGSADSLPLRCCTLPVCGSQLPRISQAELLSVIRSTLCHRTMMSLPYGDVF